jgi:hypothetical protein
MSLRLSRLKSANVTSAVPTSAVQCGRGCGVGGVPEPSPSTDLMIVASGSAGTGSVRLPPPGQTA